MNIRQAILKAADHVERDSTLYDFMVCTVPHSCGTPACALGWIGYYAGSRRGVTVGTNDQSPAIALLGYGGDTEFYRAVESCIGWPAETFAKRSASEIAAGLRAYADSRFPAESRALIPASVMRIFTMSPAELQREMSSV